MKPTYPSFRDENNVPIPIDWRLAYAQQQIKDTYSDTVSIIKKLKPLSKFGTNEAVGTTRATIMTLGAAITQETFVQVDTALSMSSSSTSDTLKSLVLYEGHTSSGSDLTFVPSQLNVELTGRTEAPLGISRTRSTRARLDLPAIGDIYFYDSGAALTNGVPTDLTKVHMMIPAGDIQSQKASTAISSTDYYIITNWSAGVLEKTSAFAQARIEIKPWTTTTDSWYPITKWLAVSDANGSYGIGEGSPYLIVPKNHDVRMTAIANTAGIGVVGGMEGFLATTNLT